MKIKKLLFTILISSFLIADVKPDDIFNLLDLSTPGMEKVKIAVEKQQFKTAHKELLTYFQNRTNRKLNASFSHYNKEKVENALNNIFIIKKTRVDFGEKVDWTRIHEDKEWQFSLGRMKWFEDYVSAYKENPDKKYIESWMSQIESWMELNDPGYPRTIDTGRRLENWALSYYGFIQVLKSKYVNPEFHSKMLVSFYQQAEFQYNPKQWRRFSNWGTFENSGFSYMAILFPEFKDSEKWMAELFFRMRFQLNNSFHKDGMHIEVTPSYLTHELQVWQDFIIMCKENGIESPLKPQIVLPSLTSLIIPPAYAMGHFYKPTGYCAQISDTDSRDERDFLVEVANYYKLDDLLWMATGSLEGKVPENTSAAYPEGGYYIMRSGWGDRVLDFDQELFMIFDVGTNQPWHAHYDILNVVATAYGYDLLKDAGRFTYNDGPDREAFKSTAYHNTVTVDGQSQKRYYTPPQGDYTYMKNVDYAVGHHFANEGVEHRRSVFFLKPEYWIVIDKMNSDNEHLYEQNWHLSDLSMGKISIDESQVKGPHLFMDFFNTDATLSQDTGYLAYEYRKKVEAPIIRSSVNNDNSLLPVLLYPYDKEAPHIETETLAGFDNSTGIALKIKHAEFIDYYFEKFTDDSKSFRIDTFSSDAKVLWLRMNKQGKLVSLYMNEGSEMKYKSKMIVKIKGKKTSLFIQNNTVEVSADFLCELSIAWSSSLNELTINGNNTSYKSKRNKLIFEAK